MNIDQEIEQLKKSSAEIQKQIAELEKKARGQVSADDVQYKGLVYCSNHRDSYELNESFCINAATSSYGCINLKSQEVVFVGKNGVEENVSWGYCVWLKHSNEDFILTLETKNNPEIRLSEWKQKVADFINERNAN